MPDRRDDIVEVVPARAALAGNPSDMYGGAVLAVPVTGVTARVAARPADHFRIAGVPFATLADLRTAVAGRRLTGLAALAAAAVDTLAARVGPPRPCAVEVATTIPRSVGLAGSSAVVIGVLRAVARCADQPVIGPLELAELALAAEVDGLGIAAGLQDRIVQCHGRAMHMDFARGVHEPVEPDDRVDLLVAHRPDAAAPSHATHGPLRARFEAGEPRVREAMAGLAASAHDAAAALGRGDRGALAEAIDGSFELRRTVVDLDPRHVEMVDVARRAGAAANFAGSGGSISVLAPDPATEERVGAVLRELGCGVLPVTVGGAGAPPI